MPFLRLVRPGSRVLVIAVASFCLGLFTSPAMAGGTYARIEASFNLNGLSTDPVVLFDYTKTDVQVSILQPDSTTVVLPAFYDGGTIWRVRHTPSIPGNYQITGITLNGSPISYSNLTPTNWVVTGFPTGPGFVGVDPTDPRRFVTSNGRRYFPVGENMAWSSPTANALNIFPKMGAAHENWSRVWMTHFYAGNGLDLNLDWPLVNNTFGNLSLTVASNWDAIVAAADQAGIHFQMTLQHHGQYSSVVDANWPQNPYNTANGGFLANATNFFTDPTAIALTKVKLRYTVARWGYSPGIMAWELFNEVQFTDAAGDGNTSIGQWGIIQAWHDEMAAFLRAQDPYQHLITTSSVLNEPIWDETDYYQHHEYPSDLITGLRDAQDISPSQPVAPDFAGECGISTLPHAGISPPIWAGIMSAQSGAAMPWYWDTIDPNNDYFLIQAAADFVTVSGLADEDALAKSSPQVTGGALGPLVFSPGGGWGTAIQDTFAVGDAAPDGIGTAPSYLQGQYHGVMTPNGYTFLVNYTQNGAFAVQVLQIAASGSGLRITLDGNVVTNVSFPSYGSDTSTNFTASIPVYAGSHSINIFNPGLDWFLLGNITLNPYVPAMAAYAIGTNNWQALWLWNRTNVFAASPGPSVNGTVTVAGLDPGTYSATWWDTFGAGAISNVTFSVANSNSPVTLATPPVLRSVALYVGLPAHAGTVIPDLARSVVSNSPPSDVPLVITNSGGLPLSYSLSVTSAVPAWLSFSSTNGYVSAASSENVYFRFDPSGLASGTYSFTVFLKTGDPALPVMTLPVTLTIISVRAAPVMVSMGVGAGGYVFQVQGSAGIPYTIQSSPDLFEWTSISTNPLPGGELNVTNSISPGSTAKFWRAIWQP